MDGLDDLLSQIHLVDQQAARVWFLLRRTFRPQSLIENVGRAMYGYRYWPRVKAAIISMGPTLEGPLVPRAIGVADAATRTARVDRDQLVAIAAVGCEIYEQVGHQTFVAMPSEVRLPPASLLETPTMVLQRRARNTPEGLLGAWRGARRQWKITCEPDPDDSRVVTHGHPLVRCSGADHAGCMVVILAGAERLSPAQGHDPYPPVRQACDARVFGRVSLTYLPPPLSAASSRSICC